MVRLRNRYVVIQLVYDGNLKKTPVLRANSLMESLNKSIRDLHGIQGVGLSKAGLSATYLNRETNIAFVRMRISAYKIVASALAMINSLDGEPCSLKSLYTGATIKQCNKFLCRFHRRQIELQFASIKSEVKRKELELELQNCLVIPSNWKSN